MPLFRHCHSSEEQNYQQQVSPRESHPSAKFNPRVVEVRDMKKRQLDEKLKEHIFFPSIGRISFDLRSERILGQILKLEVKYLRRILKLNEILLSIFYAQSIIRENLLYWILFLGLIF